MFASQLLRVLQTLPSGVNYETCAFDTVEPEATMKENQNEALYHSNVYGRDADPLAFETNDKDDFWNTPELNCSVFVDDFTVGNENEENQNGILCYSQSLQRDADPIACETVDKDEFRNTPELKCSAVLNDLANGNENDIRNSSMEENQNGILYYSNGCQRDTDPLVSETTNRDEFWYSPELKCSVVVDDFTTCNEKEMRDSVEPCSVSSELIEKDADLYTDKNVMECELPELIVCYKESTYHVVKDICIDEGVPSEDKILIESSEDDHRSVFTSLPGNENNHSDKAKESVEIELLMPERFKPSLENESATKEKMDSELLISDKSRSASEVDIDNDSTKECGVEDPKQMSEVGCNATGEIIDDASKVEFVSLKSILQSSNNDRDDVEQQSCQIPCAETIVESQVSESFADESDKNRPADSLVYNSKVESGTITFDFDSSKSADSSRAESPEKNVHEPTLESQNVPNLDDGISDNLSVTSQVQRGEGESSFSAAGPVSGLITYSGSIPFSGSISLRSDSSTTSTRSFAFPVLQTEWNSSPVRMAKADRRRFRKHGGWKQGLLCCKF